MKTNVILVNKWKPAGFGPPVKPREQRFLSVTSLNLMETFGSPQIFQLFEKPDAFKRQLLT